jgi:hypothetical protein
MGNLLEGDNIYGKNWKHYFYTEGRKCRQVYGNTDYS